ncbi:MAG: hypothetical protein AAFY29_03540 [Pseudomonadota bacterium]
MMPIEEFRGLLDVYGGDVQRWPETKRAEMEAMIASNADALSYLTEARALDAALDAFDVPAVDLSQRVLDALPMSPVEKLLAWLLPPAPQQWWRPAMAAMMPVFLGVMIGFGGSAGETTDWDAQEQALLGGISAEYLE